MSINVQQRIFLWLGVLAFAFLTLRPPWVAMRTRPAGVSSEADIGSQFVWRDLQSGYSFIRVDFQRLVLEWLAVVAITGALLWTFKGRPDWQFGRINSFVSKAAAATLVGLLQTFKSRILSIGLLIAGLLLITAPVTFRWSKWRWQSMQYAARVSVFKRKIPELALRYPVIGEVSWPQYVEKGNDGKPPVSTDPPFQVVAVDNPFDVPGVGTVTFPDNMSGREVANTVRINYPNVPGWYLDAVAADVNLIAVRNDEKPGSPPEPFSLWGAVLDSSILESIGCAAFVLGAASLGKTAYTRLGVCP